MKEILTATMVLAEKGLKLEGHYQGLRVLDSEFGQQKVHRIDTKSGPIELYGCAQLNSKLGFVKKDSFVKLAYLGKVKSASGEGSEHTWKVEVE